MRNMTPEEFKLAMERIYGDADYDPEAAHGAADTLMCELLHDLGYHEGVAIFVMAVRWYAPEGATTT